MNRFLLVALLLSVGLDSIAQLEWTTTQVQTNIPIGETELKINFPYINSGSSSVSISNIVNCCGCKTVVSEPICEPGSNGYVEVRCDLKGRYGKFRKKIPINYSGETKYLIIRFTNPEVVSLEPRSIKWTGGSSDMKKIRLTNLTTIPINVQEVSVIPEVCKVFVETVKSGGLCGWVSQLKLAGNESRTNEIELKKLKVKRKN